MDTPKNYSHIGVLNASACARTNKSTLQALLFALVLLPIVGCSGESSVPAKSENLSPAEAHMRNSIATLTELVVVLKSIIDEPSAIAATPKLKVIETRTQEILQLNKEFNDPVEAARLGAKYKAQQDSVKQEMIAESRRILALPGLSAKLSNVFPFNHSSTGLDDDAKRAKARVEVSLIKHEVDLHKAVHGSYPKSLKDIRNVHTKWSETDPWGTRYEYETEIAPNLSKFRVWTSPPTGGKIEDGGYSIKF